MDPLTLRWLEAVAAFVVGTCIGSFLNVCVYRIPLNRSVISPGSHCAACGAPIPWYHNLPVLSWINLDGRAACCGTRIDVRYPVVELGVGLLFLGLWLSFAPLEAVIYAIMTSGLVAACLIDLDHYIIPDRFTLGGCLAGFIACTIDPALMGEKTAVQGFSWSLASAIIGGLTLLAVAWGGTLLFKKEAMGMGDVKFLDHLDASPCRRHRRRAGPGLDRVATGRLGHAHPLRAVPRTCRAGVALRRGRFDPRVLEPCRPSVEYLHRPDGRRPRPAGPLIADDGTSHAPPQKPCALMHPGRT
jgi:prepilin signal peptidase PulO-like enzyme (type II secretory pathway)